MAIKKISIGSLKDIHRYDDGTFPEAIIAEGPIKAGKGTSGNHVMRFNDLPDGGLADGDKLDIDWNPSNYTPDSSIGEADDADDLAAHLKGIDDELGSGPTGTADRLADYDASGDLDEVSDLTDYISGTGNEIDVSDDGDGTITIGGDGDTATFAVVTDIQAGGAGAIGFQYKTRTLTVTNGIVSNISALSGWNDV